MPDTIPHAPAAGLTVITTHVNADFDALASMLAAQKLYPEGLVVFPGSQEKNLRNFFIHSMAYLFNMADIKDIELDQVRRLVLVDTRQANRIGKLAALVDRKDVEIHVYDHHPDAPNDIAADHGIQRLTGATVTLLTEIIAERDYPLSPDEATILCLGIYEDTGSFTFSSTTPADFEAAAYLVSKGANLNDVSSLITRELTPRQVGLLNDMLQAARHYMINGIDVVLTTVTTDDYVTDFAFLVHKMVRMENLDAIFALAHMGSKVYVVARSRLAEVDVGAIIASLGGGGHPYAAAATIKGQPMAQIEQRLIEMLYTEIRPARRAKDIMSSPAISVDAGITCRHASEYLNRYNVNALLVTSVDDTGAHLTGMITRQVIEKALFHKLGDSPVSDFMSTEFATVGPEADISDIQEKIIDSKQRILPVMKDNRPVGVVTRTDLLKILVRRTRLVNDHTPDPMAGPAPPRTRNIRRFMSERLSDRMMETLHRIGQVAENLGFAAYGVGGFVRDLFLYRANEDIDIVIEGNGIQFAKEFARMNRARVHTHEKFGTAVIIFPDDYKIDVASARMEYYQSPAALPTVEMSSIKLDLYRRDFTINTLAIQLNPEPFGTLIDFFSAYKDLKEKTIRVLHNLSFVEDPTRIFRAIRFEQRFEFSIGKLTAGLIENAVKMDFFKRLSGRRVFTELRLILEEENPTASLVRLADFQLIGAIHPSIQFGRDLVAAFTATRKVMGWYDLLFLEESYMKWAVYFMALIRPCDRNTTEEICDRFELPPKHRRLFCDQRFEAERCLYWMERHLPAGNSAIYRRLDGFRSELALYMMAATEKDQVKQAISQYFTKLRYIFPSVTGKDLRDMGLKPGPRYRMIMDAIQDALLNGDIHTRSEELDMASGLIDEYRK